MLIQANPCPHKGQLFGKNTQLILYSMICIIQNNFTQSELASIIGYSNSSTIKDIELGKKLIGRNHSEKLAKFFNLDTRYFFDNYLEDTYSIAEKLKKYRKENNLNIKEAANKLNVAANTFGQWENRKAYPSRLLYPRLKELQIL